MLLTLSTQSLLKKMGGKGKGFSILEMPNYAIHQLQLRGLNITASMLSGWSLEDLDQLRDRADKAACPCLILIEDTPLAMASPDEEERKAAQKRINRLGAAASRLGCNAVAIMCESPDTEEAFETASMEIREAMHTLERLELNLLLMPHEGLTYAPDRLTDVIKRVGGFRIGTLPTFAHAAETGNTIEALRKLAPYAGAIHASIDQFDQSGEQKNYNLTECVEAIRSVGFVHTLAIEYTGSGDPIPHIERARDLLQTAIDSEPV